MKAALLNYKLKAPACRLEEEIDLAAGDQAAMDLFCFAALVSIMLAAENFKEDEVFEVKPQGDKIVIEYPGEPDLADVVLELWNGDAELIGEYPMPLVKDGEDPVIAELLRDMRLAAAAYERETAA